mgnify:FL=1
MTNGAEMAIVELIGSEYKGEKKTARTPGPKATEAKADKPEKAARPRKPKEEGDKPAGKSAARGKAKAKGKKAEAAAE